MSRLSLCFNNVLWTWKNSAMYFGGTNLKYTQRLQNIESIMSLLLKWVTTIFEKKFQTISYAMSPRSHGEDIIDWIVLYCIFYTIFYNDIHAHLSFNLLYCTSYNDIHAHFIIWDLIFYSFHHLLVFIQKSLTSSNITDVCSVTCWTRPQLA